MSRDEMSALQGKRLNKLVNLVYHNVPFYRNKTYLMAGILVLTAFALVLDGLVGRIERRLMKWQPKAGEVEKL